MIVSRPRSGREVRDHPAPPLVFRELRSWIFWKYHCQKLSHSTFTLTMCWGRMPNQCMRYECCALMALPASHCGMSPGPQIWQECSMHRLHGGVILTWATLHNFLLELRGLGFLPPNASSFAEMCEAADDGLFASFLHNGNHVLAQLLSTIKETPYQLRPRAHNRSSLIADTLLWKNFIEQMLYKDSNWSSLISLLQHIILII